MKKLIAVIAALSLAACVKSPAEQQAAYEQAKLIDQQAIPERVGTTANGLPILRQKITAVPAECDGCSIPGTRPHYIYYVGGTITVNNLRPSGKTTEPMVTVTINEAMPLTEAQARIDKMLREEQERKINELRKGDAK